MEFTEKTILHIAELAKLAFTSEEKEAFTTQLGNIVDMVEKLNELDTEGVPGTYHGIVLENIYREDEVESGANPKALLNNAPTTEGTLIKVPAMIDNEGEGA